MDSSKEFQFMFDRAIESEPLAFKSFDRTKNVQDQLQEMLGDYRSNLARIYWWSEQGTVRLSNAEDYWGYDHRQFTSMEQLWLAFVMSEKYNKIWDGEAWTGANLSPR